MGTSNLSVIKHWVNILSNELQREINREYGADNSDYSNGQFYVLEHTRDSAILNEILSEMGLLGTQEQINQIDKDKEELYAKIRELENTKDKLRGELARNIQAVTGGSERHTCEPISLLRPQVIERRRDWMIKNGYERIIMLQERLQNLNRDVSLALAEDNIKEFVAGFLKSLKE